MSSLSKAISLTAILVQEDSGFTAFFAQVPNIIAEGKDEEAAMKNLFELVQKVFEHQSQEETTKAEKMAGLTTVKTHTFEFASA